MTDLKIKKAAEDETAKIEETVKESEKEMLTPFLGRVPCYWQVIKTEDGISASNSETNETFEGSLETFNKRLRG